MHDPCSTPTRHRTAIRVALAGVGLIQLVDGLYALFAPSSFYSDFPLGRGWVEALPAYNEHLVRDVGGLFLATARDAAGGLMGARAPAGDRRGGILPAVLGPARDLSLLQPRSVRRRRCDRQRARARGDRGPADLVLIELRSQARRPAAPARSAGPGDGNARIAGVPEDTRSPLVRLSYRESRRRYGAVADPLRVFAHHPRVLLGYAALEAAPSVDPGRPERLKHLAEVRAAMLCGCEWCLDFGSAISAEAGVGEQDLRELPTYASSARFTELERAVLDYATAMSRSPAEVSDELFDRLRAELDEAQLVELTSIIALENYRARFNWAFGIEGQGFAEGSFCVAPEARAPAVPGATSP